MIKQSPKGEDDLYIYNPAFTFIIQLGQHNLVELNPSRPTCLKSQHLPSSFNWVNITYIEDLLA